jgi:peptidoglycan-associated lipoprotein
VQKAAESLRKVFFDYDSSSLTGGTRTALSDTARILKENNGVKLEVQGHCDERGTTSYNMGLGERRARAVYRYLVDQGVSSSRLKTVSYGEERPAASGGYESAWSQNRRAEFRVTYKEGTENVKGTVQ